MGYPALHQPTHSFCTQNLTTHSMLTARLRFIIKLRIVEGLDNSFDSVHGSASDKPAALYEVTS